MIRRIWPAPVPLMIHTVSPTTERSEDDAGQVAAVSESVVLVAEVTVPDPVTPPWLKSSSGLGAPDTDTDTNRRRSPQGVPTHTSCAWVVLHPRHIAEG